MKLIEIELTGDTPLMHHRMSDETIMELLGASKTKRKKDKEILTPRQIAEKAAYRGSDGTYYIPTGYIMGAFKHVAADYKQSNSKRTVKAIASGVFRPTEQAATLLDENDNPITDFEVDIQKATNHKTGAVVVCRPRFDRWKIKTVIQIDDALLSSEVAHDILSDAGKRSGIGSFRISKGGYYGSFRVTKFEEKPKSVQ